MLAAFMRNMASNTHLIDIPTLRFAMSLGGMIPTPSDALITPVTFRVRKRRLRGFLRKWDELETGKREIQSEWVVGKRLWQRLQREWKGLQQQQQRGGNAAFVTATPHVAGRSSFRRTHSSHHHHHNKVKERVVLFLHGGEYWLYSFIAPSFLPSCISGFGRAAWYFDWINSSHMTFYPFSPRRPLPRRRQRYYLDQLRSPHY
jgi:hypothetical protein